MKNSNRNNSNHNNILNCVRRVTFTLLATVITFGAYAKSTVTEAGDDLILANEHVKIIFDNNKKQFDIKSIELSGKKVLSEAGKNQAPWMLTYIGAQGENPDLYPNHAVYKGYKAEQVQDTLKLEFSWLLTLSYSQTADVKMTVSLPDDSELVYWNLESGTPKGWVVHKTEFPRIHFDRPENGKFITSAGWGAEFDLKTELFESSYPSVTGSMQLIMIDREDGAIYWATQDYNACGKDFKADVNDEELLLYTEIVNSEAWSNHETGKYVIPWNSVMGFSAKGWKDAALKWYRPFTFTTDWGNKTLEERNIPQWLYDNDMWLRTNFVEEKTIEAVRWCLDYFGKGVSNHWYFWHNYPYDTHYPDYFPAKPNFAKYIAEVQAKGSHVVPYINGRLWDPDADSYKARNGASASCRKYDGTLYTEIYPTSKVLNTVTCPYTDLWHTMITELVDRIQGELHTNGVYIDQVACAAPQPCYNRNHGHAVGGGDFWYRGYDKLMTDLRANHLRDNNIFISEEQAECYLDMFDILLCVNTPHKGCRVIPLFPIVYSGRVLTIAHTYNSRDMLSRGDFQYQNMQCFLFGSQLGWMDPTLIVGEEVREEAAFLKTLVEFRRGQHDVFNGGRYLDEVIPTGDNPIVDVYRFGKCHVVSGAIWESVKGQKVLYLVNMDKKAHVVNIEGMKPIKVDACKAIRINL